MGVAQLCDTNMLPLTRKMENRQNNAAELNNQADCLWGHKLRLETEKASCCTWPKDLKTMSPSRSRRLKPTLELTRMWKRSTNHVAAMVSKPNNDIIMPVGVLPAW